MVFSRQPGPIGLLEEMLGIDPGTLARTTSPRPGSVGYQINFGIPMQVKTALRHKLGIKVNPKSKISAQAWVKKIRDSKHVPDHYQKQIEWKGDIIYVTNPKKFKYPNDVIPKDWRNDWLSVFVTAEWEITTGGLDFVVKKDGSSKEIITVTHNPDLSKGESVDNYTKYTMTKKSRSTQGLAVERGNTLPTGVSLLSRRKLIVVANRIVLKLGSKVKNFTFDDDELVSVWFHETACHAGRNSQGLPDIHGGKTVESYTKDIDEMFPKTITIPKVLAAIKEYLKP